MRPLLRPWLLVLGTLVALIAGGGMLAFAGWISHTDSGPFTIRAAFIPPVQRPAVALVTVARPVAQTTGAEPGADVVLLPRISWRTVRITDDEGVDSYVVTRHDGDKTQIVCTRRAWRTPSCLDRTAPPGASLTYTVTATHGAHWVGADSEPSLPVTMPGPPVATGGTPVDPSPATVPGSAAATSAPPTGSVDSGVPMHAPSTIPQVSSSPTVTGPAAEPAPSTPPAPAEEPGTPAPAAPAPVG